MTTLESADAVIIGGGVIGVSIAYYLAQRNFGQIIVLERFPPRDMVTRR